MKILALVEKFSADDHNLGFLHAWLVKIASQADELYVVSLEQRCAGLEKNMNVYSAGREFRRPKIYVWHHFNKIISGILSNKKIDLVFVLMCPEYAILAYPCANLKNIPVVMWYAHGKAGLRLKIASILAWRVVSSSQDGYRIGRKLTVIGQGIDTEKFSPQAAVSRPQDKKRIILSAGRISPVKNYETLIKAADILINQKNIRDLKFQIAGGTAAKPQNRYWDFLKDMAGKYKLQDYVRFLGPVPYTQMESYYRDCGLFVSTSNTGSMDKVVLEAMACGKIVLTCNAAFNGLLKDYSHILLFDKNEPAELAEKIIYILEMNSEDEEAIARNLREIVAKGHSLDRFIDNLMAVFKEAKGSTLNKRCQPLCSGARHFTQDLLSG